ncbi:Lrp/AsnC family transcriptional regulator [Roseovarius sp. 2305UL8-3]|uniref:siroheme decarboxylase subunit beta n=1 Tax=Roseovarius conchicola TaxID=3121636 RepID=UPI0035273BC9
MEAIADPIDCHLLDNWQRDFPVTSRPFAELANDLALDEADVLDRLQRMSRTGRISRVGATCAPNTISASTLAAIAAPPERLDEVVAIISAEPGINHSYLRENEWNLWFVATGPDRAFVDAALENIQTRTGLRVLDLRLVRPFNLDLGFRMRGPRATTARPQPRQPDLTRIEAGDRDILQVLAEGLPIVARPYAALGERLNRSEEDVIERIAALQDAAIISRLGVIVRHRALGWRANAMVVWDLPSELIDTAGPRLAAMSGVTLCYERRPVPGVWPYRLYSMIHARDQAEALAFLDEARTIPELSDVPYEALFSTQCFKQTGAMIKDKPVAAA